MTRLPLLLAFVLTLAGCMGPGGDAPGDANDTTQPDGEMASLPPPIEVTQDVSGSADPGSSIAGPPCSTPSAQCFRYPFALNASALVSASLTWSVPANDFDLYIFSDGEPITDQGGSPPPGTSESFDVELDAGGYELVVSAYAVGQDTFTLNATFAPVTN